MGKRALFIAGTSARVLFEEARSSLRGFEVVGWAFVFEYTLRSWQALRKARLQPLISPPPTEKT
jgi:hypothetical protein